MVNMDMISGGQGTGEVAGMLAANGRMDIAKMRPYFDTKTGQAYVSVYQGGDVKDPQNYKALQVNAATLRRDEWKQLDEAVLLAARTRLGGIADLEAKGLVYNLGNALGTTVLEWHDVSDGFDAALTMDGVTRSKGDRVTFQHNYLPIPILHVDYEINSRVLESSRALGNPLDTTSAEQASRRIAEKLESMLFKDETYSFGEKDSRGLNTIYSYVNHPDRNKVTLSVAWDASAKSAADIVEEVLAMKQDSINARHYGPWVLYIPTGYETILDQDYNSTTPGTTIRERILKISGIEAVKVSDSLPDDNVVLVQMTADTVRLVKGIPLQNVQWSTEGGFVNKFKVMTIQVPQIRSDRDNRSGIVHLAAHA